MRVQNAKLIGLVALMTSACGATPGPVVGSASMAPDASLGQAEFSSEGATKYRLRANDKIAIRVVREPDLSFEELLISGDGSVTLPLAGMVDARGQTTEELARQIADALRQAGLRRPLVSVYVVEYASHVVTVEGGVEEPGVYAFQPGARLSAALSLANGPSRVSKLNEVVIFRETSDGMSIALFDYQSVRKGTMLDPVIEPGDRVVVGISGLSQFWQDLIRALPAFGLFTNI